MDEEEPTYSVNELADEAGITRRTVYYYISQGLLPPSGSEGRGSRYTLAHLNRLRLIRELQREHLPLAEIRHRLERLTDAQVADLVRVGEVLPPPHGSAFDYIQSVLAGTNRRAIALPAASPRTARVAEAPAAYGRGAPPSPRTAAGVAPPAGSPTASEEAPERATPVRSQWERIALAPDMELHVRRPLSRTQNRAVDKLVGLARELLEEDPQ